MPAALALLLLLFLPFTTSAASPPVPPVVEVIRGDDTSVTVRTRLPVQVAADRRRALFHFKGCASITREMEWLVPSAATLNRLTAHPGCAALLKVETVTETLTRDQRDPRVIRVLFMGNSLTYFNDMPRIAQRLAAREKRPLLVEAVTQGGATLQNLWERSEAPRVLWEKQWDYVVLQERSGTAVLRAETKFQQYIDLVGSQVKRSGAKPLVLMTWTFPGDADTTAAFRKAAGRIGGRLVPVGPAWRELVATGSFERLDWDGTHPNLYGSYLMACAVYAVIYQRSPEGLTSELEAPANTNEFFLRPLVEQKLTEGQARRLQEAAWRAVRNEPLARE